MGKGKIDGNTVDHNKKTISTINNQQSDSASILLEANLNARKERHKRVFAGATAWARFFPSFLGLNRAEADEVKTVKRTTNPTGKLLRTYGVVVTAVFAIGLVNPGNVYSQSSQYVSLDGVEDYYAADSLMIADQDGYMPKINPQTELADRTSANGKLVHEVEAGDTISTIAEQYGLKTNTIMWENGLTSSSTIKPGDKIIVPPVDGVTHVVQKNQDVKKIAALYSVPADAITKQNQLDAMNGLVAGQEIFIPGAKPLPVEVNREGLDRTQSRTRILASGAVGKTNVGSNRLVSASEIGENNGSNPAAGKSMIYPTRGAITQYYHAGHYAYDIADPSKPPIWAAMDGTVIKASSGTWGGGYGNHIIIDHGNGLKTLYGHMEYLSVQVGDTVKQGQVIGKMGRTGNVRGRTGIHLHFEVILNGVKKSPGSYF